MSVIDSHYHFFELLKGIYRSSGSMLDLGCSSGSIDFSAQENNGLRVAVDLDFNSLKKNNAFKNKTAADIFHLPFRDVQFDFIIIKYVLEHIMHPELVAATLSNLTKKNQFVYIVVPKYYAFQDTLYRALGFLSEIFGRGKQVHIQKFTFGTLCRLFYDNGFVMVDFYEAEAGLSFLDKNKIRKFFKLIVKSTLNLIRRFSGKNLLERNEMHFIFCKFD